MLRPFSFRLPSSGRAMLGSGPQDPPAMSATGSVFILENPVNSNSPQKTGYMHHQKWGKW